MSRSKSGAKQNSSVQAKIEEIWKIPQKMFIEIYRFLETKECRYAINHIQKTMDKVAKKICFLYLLILETLPNILIQIWSQSTQI